MDGNESANSTIYVCVVDESDDDAGTLAKALAETNSNISASQVKSKVALRKAVEAGECHVVAAVPGVPRFDAYKALEALTEFDSDAPVIGIRKSDETTGVVQAMENGLKDLVSHDAPDHLNMVIQRELARRSKGASATRDFTGVYSRLEFLARLQRAVESYREESSGSLGVLYAQLDSFTWINENIGIAAADEYLKTVAGVIRDTLEERDVPARYHGGTFVALIHGRGMNDLESKAHALSSAIANHVFEVEDQAISSTCSIGLGLVTDVTEEPESLITHAFLAAENAKASGGNSVRWYGLKKTAGGKSSDPEAWVVRIRQAFENDMFTLLFQPIISLVGHPTPRYEVLLRMLNEDGETILPGAFLPFAERAGLMADIDRWVVTNSILAAQDLLKAGIVPEVFLKLSGKALLEKSMPSWISQVFNERRCPGEVIVFEITQSLAVTHPSQTRMLVNCLKQLGCKIALDHCGTKPESLKVLDDFQVDYVKIDGSLIRELTTSDRARIEVKRIVDKAKSLNIGTIAESVQDASTLPTIWQYGIELIQGYFLQEPESEMTYDFSQVAI